MSGDGWYTIHRCKGDIVDLIWEVDPNQLTESAFCARCNTWLFQRYERSLLPRTFRTRLMERIFPTATSSSANPGAEQ